MWRSIHFTAGAVHSGAARHAFGTTALDLPMVFALFLLFAAKDGLERRRTDFERLNSGRRRNGREELWEHIELRAPINVTYDHDPIAVDAGRSAQPAPVSCTGPYRATR
jgi:hypothetical protein